MTTTQKGSEQTRTHRLRQVNGEHVRDWVTGKSLFVGRKGG